jgi:S-formylglutathione hydrolase FrmB
MKIKTLSAACILAVFVQTSFCGTGTYNITINLTVEEDVRASFSPDGRLLVFFSQSPYGEPRTRIWPVPGTTIFARNVSGFGAGETLVIRDPEGWAGTGNWTFTDVPEGEYYLQILWDQDTEESGVNAPGNLCTRKEKIVMNESLEVDLSLEQIIPASKVRENELVRTVDLESDTLSAWWGKPVHIKASILFPAKYQENSGRSWPIRYNIAGYGGRYTRVNQLSADRDFMSWWLSDDAPGIINVFLDGEGPYGDCYQMDSDNSGLWGYALIHELIPFIENTYRGTNDPKTRFTDGCSTGGWVSLALQLFYPETFNGAFSYSPDPVDFENYQLINIYRDENAYINEFGYLRPVMRTVDGEPVISLMDFIRVENVLGSSGTYLNSGGQICSHTALYSPKGKNGLPEPLIDPETGDINGEVAEYWKKYDLKFYAREHWEELGPKIQGKIYIWMGDMDNFYLNTATRGFDKFLKTTENPKSDAVVIFSPMEGHCSQYSHRAVLEKIRQRIESISIEPTGEKNQGSDKGF